MERKHYTLAKNRFFFLLCLCVAPEYHPYFILLPNLRLYNGNEAKEPQALEMDKAPSAGCYSVFNAFFIELWNIFSFVLSALFFHFTPQNQQNSLSQATARNCFLWNHFKDSVFFCSQH